MGFIILRYLLDCANLVLPAPCLMVFTVKSWPV